MGKETVLVRESPGFITTRVNASIGNEAFYMLMEGVASPRDIDKALKLGLNHPMGALRARGSRRARHAAQHPGIPAPQPRREVPAVPLLAQYVKAGRLGRKVGKGVYEY
jgi:3-hydroxybutyryl-CoA dehydrogenase